MKIPESTNKTGHFSKENWGGWSKRVEDPETGEVSFEGVWRATVFYPTIKNLSATHWKAIIDGAKVFMGRKDPDRAGAHTPHGLITMPDNSDFIIVDPMFAANVPAAAEDVPSNAPQPSSSAPKTPGPAPQGAAHAASPALSMDIQFHADPGSSHDACS